MEPQTPNYLNNKIALNRIENSLYELKMKNEIRQEYRRLTCENKIKTQYDLQNFLDRYPIFHEEIEVKGGFE